MQTKQLFFEDIAEGTEIPQTENKIRLIEMLRYAAATWSFFLLHLEKEYAQKQGFRDANIQGPMYGALCAKMLTNWIGDDGRLKKLGYNVRVMGFPGDTLTTRGKVARKYQRDGASLADCDLWVENQNGERVATGHATVSLPSK